MYNIFFYNCRCRFIFGWLVGCVCSMSSSSLSNCNRDFFTPCAILLAMPLKKSSNSMSVKLVTNVNSRLSSSMVCVFCFLSWVPLIRSSKLSSVNCSHDVYNFYLPFQIENKKLFTKIKRRWLWWRLQDKKGTKSVVTYAFILCYHKMHGIIQTLYKCHIYIFILFDIWGVYFFFMHLNISTIDYYTFIERL